MSKKKYLDYNDLGLLSNAIIKDIVNDGFIPDLIIAPMRGGLFLAQSILYFDEEKGKKIILTTPNIKTYSGENIADIDFKDFSDFNKALKEIKPDSKILITEDIVDSGTTTRYILKLIKEIRIDIDVRISALVTKDVNKVEYYGKLYNDEDWIVFPWDKKV